MEDNKERKPRKKENPVREWISDNLRYMMLIGAIVIVVLIIIFIVKAVRGNLSADTKAAAATESVETKEETATPTPTITATVTPTPAPTVTVTPTPTEIPKDNTLVEGKADVQTVITDYFQALTDRDPDLAAQIVHGLTEEDLAVIADGSVVDGYRGGEIFTCQGNEEGSYVVFAAYEYKYAGTDTYIPALTEFYIVTDEDGNLKLEAAPTDEQQKRINEAAVSPEVTILKENVAARNAAVMAEHPEIKEIEAGL